MKELYQKSLEAHSPYIHFAAHSHHFWPDVCEKAHQRSFELASTKSDKKWEIVFGEIIPHIQKIISGQIGFGRPDDIAFAPNVHELLTRLLSSLISQDKVINVVSSDSEFHSFTRQAKRFEEDNYIKLHTVSTADLKAGQRDKFIQTIIETVNNSKASLLYLSQVFFNSGYRIEIDELKTICDQIPDSTKVCIDGYHGHCALPTDISSIQDRIFYTSGGYKYAQSGEGVCFMTLEKDCDLRPLLTGWFSDFSGLEKQSKNINYSKNGMKFWGATQDITGFLRYQYVWDHFNKEQITIQSIHKHVYSLMEHFLTLVDKSKFLCTNLNEIGHFLCLKMDSNSQAKDLHDKLYDHHILCDFRENIIRFGFASYHSIEDVEKLAYYLRA